MIIKINDREFHSLQVQSIRMELQKLPAPQYSIKIDPNYLQPAANETIFLLPGEFAFIDTHSAVRHLGVLKQTESIQLYLFNSSGESLLLNYESSFIVDWNAIFSLFTDKNLQAKILGGGNNPTSHASFSALIASLSQSNMEVTIEFIESQCLEKNVVYATGSQSLLNKQLADMLGFNQAERTQVASGIEAIKISSKAHISNQFLTNYVIRDGLLVLVESDDYPNAFEPSRFVRYIQSTSSKNGPQRRIESSKMPMLLLYNRKPVALSTDENDISLIARLNLQSDFLEYCKKRCALGKKELFDYFKTQVAPKMFTLEEASEVEKEKTYSNFAQTRVSALFFADNLRRLREEERAKNKSPGPWVDQFRFGSSNVVR